MNSDGLKIGVVVVAYNAVTTLAQVLDRIPPAFRSKTAEVLVCDDHSEDSTYLVGLGYQATSKDLPLTVIRHPRNLGYGGNQKEAYRVASEHGLDIVVLLHGDGQYAPELLPAMVEPLERGEADAVFGSRMMEDGAARRGGMPLYKFVGNRILTAFENRMLGTQLTEFHSGYRAYRVDALNSLSLERNSDGFDFDTQIIIQLHAANKRIVEIPIPTYYGNEICYVNGLQYAREVSAEALRYRLAELGLGPGPNCLSPQEETPYEFKSSQWSSHGQLLSWMSQFPPSRLLDLGCSNGDLAEQLRKLGHMVIGVDIEEWEGIADKTDEFVRADLSVGVPDSVGGDYDVVLAADVLEHVPHPERLLRQAVERLREGGVVVACVPNFAHWYPRFKTLLGRFDYERRGILDRGHLRFFTKRSFERMVSDEHCVIARCATVGIPIELLGNSERRRWRVIERLDRLASRLRPQLFGYQFLYQLRAERAVDAEEQALMLSP